MKLLTNDELQEDLEGFYVRLQNARDKTTALPATADTWQGRQNLKEKRRILNSEIEHVKRLTGIAEEVVTDA